MTEIDLFKQFGIPEPMPFSTDLKVHVAEGSNELRLIMLHHMGRVGFRTVLSSREGSATLTDLKENPADIVLADKELPYINGLDLLKELREDPQLSRGSFILMTKPARKDEIMLALESGVDDLMIRPFTANDILPHIRHAYNAFTNPKNPERVYEFAKAKMRAKDLIGAKAVYQALADSTQSAARPLVGLARIADLENQLEAALKLASEAIARNNNFVHAFALRGEIQLKIGNVDAAIADLEKAVSLSPLNIARYESCCNVLLKNERVKPCQRILQLGIKAGLEHPLLDERMGYCHFLLKEYPQAIKYLTLAVKHDPKNNSFANSLAICYRDAGDLDQAITTYNGILKRDPRNYQVLFNKALIYVFKKDNTEAIRLLYRVLRMSPGYDKAKNKIRELGGNPDAIPVDDESEE